MPTYYLDSFVGVKDGTLNPPARADGRKVGAKVSIIYGAKPSGQAMVNGDKLFLGTLASGDCLRNVRVNTDTTLGTTTLSIGTLANATKYANAATVTTITGPVSIGPLAVPAVAGPLTAPEDIYATLGVGGIAGAVNVAFELEIASIK